MNEYTPPRGVVAVIRAPSADIAEIIAIGLAEGGVPAIEITMTVPDAVSVIERLRGIPARLGAGTVLDAETASACVEAGATFIVSPDTDKSVIDRSVTLGVPAIAGALTPTEVRTAIRLGARAAKVFPISAVGGVAYIRSLVEPLPDIELVVSGGIRVAEVNDYLNAGCAAVCLGKELIDRGALQMRDVAAITRHAQRVMDSTTRPGA